MCETIDPKEVADKTAAEFAETGKLVLSCKLMDTPQCSGNCKHKKLQQENQQPIVIENGNISVQHLVIG